MEYYKHAYNDEIIRSYNIIPPGGSFVGITQNSLHDYSAVLWQKEASLISKMSRKMLKRYFLSALRY